MATPNDVFYAFCTFWTGDWDWLAEKNGPMPEPVATALAEKGITIHPRALRTIRQPLIPYCPFCGSVGFEIDRETWLRQAREWENGTSPEEPGVLHPDFTAMLLWSEKKCFPTYAALEQAWRVALVRQSEGEK